jgi:hypothetical protein
MANDKNGQPSTYDEAVASGLWAELAARDRAASPDGKTGMDRLVERWSKDQAITAASPRLSLTVSHDGAVHIKTCDDCTGDLTAVITVLEQVADDLRNGRHQ